MPRHRERVVVILRIEDENEHSMEGWTYPLSPLKTSNWTFRQLFSAARMKKDEMIRAAIFLLFFSTIFRRRTSTRVEKCESLIPITCRAKQISSINRWEMKPSPAWSTRFSLLHLSSLFHFLRVKRRLLRRGVFFVFPPDESPKAEKGIKNFCSLPVHVLGVCRYVPESDLEWWYCRRERESTGKSKKHFPYVPHKWEKPIRRQQEVQQLLPMSRKLSFGRIRKQKKKWNRSRFHFKQVFRVCSEWKICWDGMTRPTPS